MQNNLNSLNKFKVVTNHEYILYTPRVWYFRCIQVVLQCVQCTRAYLHKGQCQREGRISEDTPIFMLSSIMYLVFTGRRVPTLQRATQG